MSEANQIQRVVIRRCPKCGNNPVTYTEVWENHGIEFSFSDDGSLDGDGYKIMGQPSGVMANCICGNTWKLRGVAQITDLYVEGE